MADTGAGIGSAASGFGRGLAKALLNNRDRADQKKREEAARQDRAFQYKMPILIKLGEDTGDWSPLEQEFAAIFPEQAKAWKKEGSPFESLGALLTKQNPGFGAEAPDATTLDRARMEEEQNEAIAAGNGSTPLLPNRPFAQAATPPAPTPPRKTLFDVPLPTDEERLEKRVNTLTAEGTAELEAKRRVAQRLMTQGMSAAEAYDRVGLRSSTSSMTPPQPGSFGQQVLTKNAERAQQGQPPMNAAETQAYMVQWERDQATAQRGFGVDREAIAGAMFKKSYGELEPEQMQVVISMEQQMLQAEGTSRRLGTGIGAFQAPIDIPTAQTTGQAVGTSAAQIAGQVVPTSADRVQRRGLEALKLDLARVQELLAVLPSENELAGAAPGATLAVRRRMNSASAIIDPATNKPLSHRAAIAQLEGVVEAAVGVLNRTRNQQVGTQTEQDAQRAYNSLIQIQKGLTDPFGGDTRESAAIRLTEALAGLDRVIAALPEQPVPVGPGAAGATTPPGAGAPPAAVAPGGRGAGPAGRGAGAGPRGGAAGPAGTATGMTMDEKGNIYQNGVLVAPGGRR